MYKKVLNSLNCHPSKVRGRERAEIFLGSTWGCYLPQRNSLWRGSLLPCHYLLYHLSSQNKMEKPKMKWLAFDPNTWTLKCLFWGVRILLVVRDIWWLIGNLNQSSTDLCRLVFQWTRNTHDSWMLIQLKTKRLYVMFTKPWTFAWGFKVPH